MKRTRIPKVSEKQQAELLLRKRIAAELIKEQLDTMGHVYCVECLKRPDWRGISLSHTISLARGGTTCKENTRLLCFTCHNLAHHIHEQ